VGGARVLLRKILKKIHSKKAVSGLKKLYILSGKIRLYLCFMATKA
jgi:hypothetical protein